MLNEERSQLGPRCVAPSDAPARERLRPSDQPGRRLARILQGGSHRTFRKLHFCQARSRLCDIPIVLAPVLLTNHESALEHSAVP